MTLKIASIVGLLFIFTTVQANDDVNKMTSQEKADSISKYYESAIPENTLETSSDDTSDTIFQQHENSESINSIQSTKNSHKDEVQIEIEPFFYSEDSRGSSEVSGGAPQLVQICLEEARKGPLEVKNIGDAIEAIKEKPELKQFIDTFATIYDQDDFEDQLSKLKKRNYAKTLIDRWQILSLLGCSLSKGFSVFYPKESYLGYVISGLYIARFGVCLIDELIMKNSNNKRKDILNTFSAERINRSDVLICSDDVNTLLEKVILDAINISQTVNIDLLNDKQKHRFDNLNKLIDSYTNKGILHKLCSAGDLLVKWLGIGTSLAAGVGAGVAIVWHNQSSKALESTNLVSGCADIFINSTINLNQENDIQERKLLDLCEMAYLCNDAFYYPQKESL